MSRPETISGGWFGPLPADRIAFLRIATGLFALWYLWPRIDMFRRIPLETSAELFAPVGVVRLLDAPLPAAVWGVALALLIPLAFLYLLGAAYRFTGPLFALLLLAVLSYRNSWSMIYHSDNAMVLQVLILGFAPAARSLSLDAWSRGRFWNREEGTSFGWPVRTILAATLATYFVAGVAKIAGPLGWSWALGTNMRDQVAVDAIRKEAFASPSSPLAYLLYDETLVYTIIGVSSLLFELGAPLALLHRRLAWGWALATFAMHWGIFAIMDIRFRYCLSGVIFLCCFPVEHLPRAAYAGLARVRGTLGRRPGSRVAPG